MMHSHNLNNTIPSAKAVLILVVMDDALAQRSTGTAKLKVEGVLILVVMDDALAQRSFNANRGN